MIKVQSELVRAWIDGFGTCELDLFDKVLVGDLCEPSPLVGIEIDIIDPEGGVSEAPAGDGHAASPGPGGLHQEV